LDRQIPTGKNLHFSADHSVVAARRGLGRGVRAVDGVDGAPFQNITHKQLGIGLVRARIKEIKSRCSADAQEGAECDCPLAFEESKEDVTQVCSGAMLYFSWDLRHSFNL
jgi:hypothetical protein